MTPSPLSVVRRVSFCTCRKALSPWVCCRLCAGRRCVRCAVWTQAVAGVAWAASDRSVRRAQGVDCVCVDPTSPEPGPVGSPPGGGPSVLLSLPRRTEWLCNIQWKSADDLIFKIRSFDPHPTTQVFKAETYFKI